MLSRTVNFFRFYSFRICNVHIFISEYEEDLKKSWVWEELYAARNVRPSFHSPLGMWGGFAYTGLFYVLARGKEPWTLKYGAPDHAMLKPAKECKQIEYPRADGKISFDLLGEILFYGAIVSTFLVSQSSSLDHPACALIS